MLPSSASSGWGTLVSFRSKIGPHRTLLARSFYTYFGVGPLSLPGTVAHDVDMYMYLGMGRRVRECEGGGHLVSWVTRQKPLACHHLILPLPLLPPPHHTHLTSLDHMVPPSLLLLFLRGICLRTDVHRAWRNGRLRPSPKYCLPRR